MKELFTRYSINEIFMFIVILALAIKGLVTFFDWAHDRLKKHFDKNSTAEKEQNEIKKQLKEIIDNQNKLNTTIEDISDKVDILFNSDKDDIKAWITEKHHYFCYKLGYIDDFNLNCIEKRYGHYKEENGNSFVTDLMEDIRKLPIVSADQNK